MKPRTLLVLLLLVVGLGSFIWFFERDLPSTEERREQSRKLVSFDSGEVQELELTSAERRILLRRAPGRGETDGDWNVVEPLRGRADGGEVEEFLETMGNLEKVRTLEEGSRDELGLATPRAEVRIGSEHGFFSLKLGAPIPASDNTIVEVESGPPFYVVRDALLEDISRPVDDWRSRDAIPVARDGIRRIDITTLAQGVALERSAAGADFRLVAPIEDDVDSERLSGLINALTGLEIAEFLDEAGAAPELEAPAASVKLALEGRAEPIDVSIAPRPLAGAAEETTVAMSVDGQVFLAETDLASRLSTEALYWRSPKWSKMKSYEIDSARITRHGETVVLEREGGAWQRDGNEISYSVADDFLRFVVEADGVPTELSDPPEAPAEIEIVLSSSDGEETLRLWDGKLAARSGRSALLALSVGAVDDLFAKLIELRKAPIKEEEEG